MSIRSDSKKIISHLLDMVISCGNLQQHLTIQHDSLVDSLGFESIEYYHICCQYLHQLGYIKTHQKNDDNRIVELTAKGIDFLESI